MNTSAVASLVRGWVGLYTRGLPSTVKAARRDEVEDDLWCQREEAVLVGRSLRSLNVEMFLRLLLGLPADISWRLSHRAGAGAPAPERRSSLGTRVIGTLAVVGGASWLVSAGVALIVGPIDGERGLTVLSVGGAMAFAGALIGLTTRFQDHLTPLAGLMGVLAGMAVAIGLFGAYVTLPLFPIGSAILMWDLGRAGILSRGLSIAHVVTALGMLLLLVTLLVNWRFASDGRFVALVIPYLVSWVAIGAFVVGGVPQVPVNSESHR